MNTSVYINSAIEMDQYLKTGKLLKPPPHNETDNLNSPVIIFKNKFQV